MFRYAVKRVARSYRLFLSLTIGVLIASTFFASMLVSADVLTSSSLSTALEGIQYDARVQENNITWTNSQFNELQSIMDDLPEVKAADRFTKLSYTYNSTLGQSFDIIGFDTDSALWNGLDLINGSSSLQANETYLVASSVNGSLLTAGEVLHVPIRIFTTDSPLPKTIFVNLTVAGYVDISDQSAQLLHPQRVIDLGFIQIPVGDWRNYNILLADWNLTFKPIIEYYSSLANASRILATSGFACQLNRDMLINPYDIGGSSTNVANAISKIEDRTAAYNTTVTNLIGTTLSFASLASAALVLAFITQAAPIIFMAWYSSTMLSDVSYNLRRREFGLLQTRGIAPGSIKRMLMFEGAIIGLIGGIVGMMLGIVFGHFVVNVPLTDPLGDFFRSPINTIVVIAFSMIIAVWSVRGPADRASKLEPLDSLKQYVFVEEQREYKRLLPTIALVLGTYKIIVWALGISMSTLLSTALSVNFILLIAVAIWTPVDAFLNFAGPIMFLYGVTKILLKGSEKFQIAVMNAGQRIFGAFGKLSTRNVRRNPVRNAALVFVISLIVSYGVYSVGILFTTNDRVERNNLFTVGADVSATFLAGQNMTPVVNTIENINGVASLTVEYHITMSTTRAGIDVRGINPSNWRDSAYYENAWFSYGSLDDLLSNFTGNKILLSISVARQFDLRVGNYITLRGVSSSDIHQMEIIGFVGYPSLFEGVLGQFAPGGSYQSYVPNDFLEENNLIDYSQAHVLIKTEPNVNGTLLQSKIQSRLPQVEETDSFTSRQATSQESTFETGATRARLLGVTFAAVLAIVGTLLVITLTLREKQYETTLLGVRGFNMKQTLTVLAGEVMVLVLFSLILGTGTGFIQLFGDISNTVESSSSIIRPRIILTPISILSMLAIVFGVVLAALIPVINAARFSEERVDIVRE